MQPKPSRPAIRSIAFLFFSFALGLALFAHGYFGWAAGAMLISSKGKPSFIATPSGDTAFSFYAHTIGFMGIGSIITLLALWLTWLIFFSSSPKKPFFIYILSQPIWARHSLSIPNWLFWFVIGTFVSLFVYAAIKAT
ncbi:MAG: hypothetical protein IV101_19770 [Dechloromonas sp.]|uniref:hypothetical protein n=1 Tax=Dechloromonas sp. TaxID=1917218 RepID=UPI0027E60EB1|nr:hypothetical protein [Dechloromonas sp.]MBT9523121.1 hypothetical protein [Dechloromonas sp.]